MGRMSGSRIDALIKRREATNPERNFVHDGRHRKYRFEDAQKHQDPWAHDSDLYDRIAAQEADLVERVLAAQSLYGGGMEKPRNAERQPVEPVAKPVPVFSTHNELQSERLELRRQLDECVDMAAPQSGVDEPVSGTGGLARVAQVSTIKRDWAGLVTPASTWVLDRDLAIAAETANSAQARLAAARAVAQREEQLHGSRVQQAQDEARALADEAAAAQKRAEEAQEWFEQMRDGDKKVSDEADMELHSATLEAERADDVYQELQEQSQAMADQLYVQAEQRDSIYAAARPELTAGPQEAELRLQYHQAARVQRDVLHGVPGQLPMRMVPGPYY